MNPFLICGAECGIVAAGATPIGGNLEHWDFGQNVSVSTSTVRTGLRSYRISAPGGSAYVRAAPNTTSTRYVGRFYLRVAAWPTTTANVMYANVAAGSAAAIQVDATTHELEVQIGGDVNAVSRPGAISLDTWYCIDFDYFCGTNGFAKMRVDGGTTYQSDTTQTATTFSTGVRIGTAASDATLDVYYDDIIFSLDETDFPIGPGTVVPLWPNTSGDHDFQTGDFQDTVGTNIDPADVTVVHTLIDDGVASGTTGLTTTADFVRQVQAGVGLYIQFGFQNPSESHNPSAVCIVSSHHASTTGANDFTMRWWDGTFSYDILLNADFSQTTIVYDSLVSAEHPFGTGWTQSNLSAIQVRWGFSVDTIGEPFLDGVLLEVAYGPAATGGVSVLLLGGL